MQGITIPTAFDVKFTLLCTNSSGPKFCSRPVRSLDFGVSLVLEPSVKPPLIPTLDKKKLFSSSAAQESTSI